MTEASTSWMHGMYCKKHKRKTVFYLHSILFSTFFGKDSSEAIIIHTLNTGWEKLHIDVSKPLDGDGNNFTSFTLNYAIIHMFDFGVSEFVQRISIASSV